MSWEIFEHFAEKYDTWYDKNKELFAKEVKCLKDIIGEVGRGVEIGVGTGRFAAELGFFIGIDAAINVLKIAKKRGIEVIRGDATSLPLKDSAFDSALLVVTLCFLDQPERSLKEIKRILINGGTLIVGAIPADSALGREYLDKGEKGHPFYSAAKFYKLSEILSMLERAGFIIKRINSIRIKSENDFVCITAKNKKEQ